jgi:UDP:flavonoid glycosyltransferase YjiC (YdhE family)
MEKTFKIIFTPFDLMAHYLRCLKIADVLKTQGHEIFFLESQTYSEMIQSHGYPIIKYQHPKVDSILKKAESFEFDWINSHSIRIMFDAYVDIIKNHKPDIIISDTALSMSMAAEFTGTFHIAIINAYISDHYSEIRPLPYNHKAFKYQFLMNEQVWLKVLKTAEKTSMKFVHRPFSALRKELKLSKKTGLLEEFEGDYNFVCDLPELFPINELPKNYAYIGPTIYESKQSEDALINWISLDNKPIIYISLGSSGQSISINFIHYPEAKNYRFIISGKKETKSDKRIYYQNFVNFDVIASHVSLMITHGGNGSIYQALKYNKPIMIIPAFFEQAWNAHRIKQLMLGEVIQPNQIQTIYKYIPSMINSSNFARTQMSQAVNNWDFEQILISNFNIFSKNKKAIIYF